MNLQMRKYRTVESWFGGFTYIILFVSEIKLGIKLLVFLLDMWLTEQKYTKTKYEPAEKHSGLNTLTSENTLWD